MTGCVSKGETMDLLHLDFNKALGAIILSILMWELRRSGWVSRLKAGWTFGLRG